MSGVHHEVSANANRGTATFNGVERGLGRMTLDVASHSESSITFILFDRGWNGFPGNPASCIAHTVMANEWRIGIGVVAVKKPTPINMSQQIFWNLDGFSSDRSQTILEHKFCRLDETFMVQR